MSKSRFNLEEIIDLKKWEKLQDSLSLVTKMAILTVDYKGVPVTKHSFCQPFCQGVRQDSTLSPYCQKCDARAGIEAVRQNKPYIYLCHFNIIDIAIPIIIDDQYLGAIMAGQLKLREPDVSHLEQIVSRPPNVESNLKFQALKEDYEALPVLSYDEVTKCVDLLLQLSTYIVEEAIQKRTTVDLYKRVLTTDMDTSTSAETVEETDLAYRKIQSLQQELSGALIETKLKNGAQRLVASNTVLQPAFDYIYAHKNENFNLKEMAKLCHISPSYFSRIFTKETGENFSLFVARLKIEWAKQLLESTEAPIHQVSDDLGFCDTGYFIKIFKRFENLTPAVYRNMYKG
ncbi:transcriptional regulator [Paenibacillus sp. VTT E-133280]|jgi:ligand-binding sensor protein/AraC-like DNA-binding protein|uniref:PocR ligand-binding domain-containing protein n=1 Tax=unclassified Paenibacillus TaxID=185978 RepID=UPI000BA07284|nr:PocR ligand-binding domain-containing protein [Paenibacillus sp. VTT E-133280]OZQ69364.1 transcriptional regulator [Paenibacillus sp. VTT E-133280]